MFVAFLFLCLVKNVTLSQANILPYIYLVYCVVGIEVIVKEHKITPAVLSALYLFSGMCFVSEYFTHSYERISVFMYPNFVEAMEYAQTLDAEKYIITPDTKYPSAVTDTEILTMFLMNIDARYWRGEVDCYEDYANPYTETFCIKISKRQT